MLIRTEQDLNALQTQVFDLIVSYDTEKKQHQQQLAGKRLLQARRAIERKREEERLASYLDQEKWFDELVEE